MRILLVASRFPLPPWRGNQVRMVQWLRALAGHDLALVAPSPGDGAEEELGTKLGVTFFGHRPGRIAAGLGGFRALATGRPVQEGIYGGAAARAALQRALAAGPWDL
ncbi:MAG TPA: hypothetical protein ENK19_06090, partial [Acidobacteria bacterium]|nr:hypothetical protein [Acidobacteriota bacterium]